MSRIASVLAILVVAAGAYLYWPRSLEQPTFPVPAPNMSNGWTLVGTHSELTSTEAMKYCWWVEHWGLPRGYLNPQPLVSKTGDHRSGYLSTAIYYEARENTLRVCTFAVGGEGAER